MADPGRGRDVPELPSRWADCRELGPDCIAHDGIAQDVVAATDALDVPGLAFKDLEESLA